MQEAPVRPLMGAVLATKVDHCRACVYFYALSMILLYIFVSVHTPIAIIVEAPHDEDLYVTMGRFLSEGKWLGPLSQFSQFTLMKGLGYPVFLAISNWLGTSVSLSHALLHCAAVVFFVVVVHRFVRSLLISCLLFTLLLWHPISLSFWLLQTTREQVYCDQLVLLLAGVTWTFFSAPNYRQTVLLAAFSGLVLGWFWLTREEGVWILPALLVLFAAAAFRSYGDGRRLGNLTVALLIFVGVFAATQLGFRAVNWWTYGKFVGVDFKERNYQRALGALASVRSGGNKPFVPITHEAMRRVSAVSPIFASLEPYFSGPRGKGWEFGCPLMPSTCGEIAAGWFTWALRDAAEEAGHYSSPTDASTFFGKLADEIEAACKRGELECSPQLISEMPQSSWHQIADGFLQNFGDAFRLLLFLDPPLEPGLSNGSKEARAVRLRFLNYPLHTKSADDLLASYAYKISGWYYGSGSDWVSISVKRPDGSIAPSQVDQVVSPDIAAHFNDPLATQQRYVIAVECSEQCVLQMQRSDGESVEERFGTLRRAPFGFAVGNGTFYVDSVSPSPDVSYAPTPADAAANDVRITISGLYKYALMPALAAGVIAFLVSTILHGSRALGNSCYVIALTAWLLVASRVTLLLLVTATSFPCLMGVYMAPAYYMLVCGAAFSCAAWWQLRDKGFNLAVEHVSSVDGACSPK